MKVYSYASNIQNTSPEELKILSLSCKQLNSVSAALDMYNVAVLCQFHQAQSVKTTLEGIFDSVEMAFVHLDNSQKNEDPLSCESKMMPYIRTYVDCFERLVKYITHFHALFIQLNLSSIQAADHSGSLSCTATCITKTGSL